MASIASCVGTGVGRNASARGRAPAAVILIGAAVLAIALAGCEKMDLPVKGKTAEALLLVDPVQTGIPGLPDAQRVMGPDLFNQYVESQVLALKNRRVVWAALDALKGEQSLYKGPNPGKSLAQDLVVERIPETMLIRVALTGRDPTQVQAISTSSNGIKTAPRRRPTPPRNCGRSATTCDGNSMSLPAASTGTGTS